MADIRAYIESQLLAPLKRYPTIIQDTLLKVITEKLAELYSYTLKFPEIVTPDRSRLDILQTIADQFLFSVRNEADIDEQVAILSNIVAIYQKRGSIDTIENMWKYYGGGLPKDVQVIIPSYNLFRYSLSSFSGAHVYPDGSKQRTGVYEIKLTNNTYPIPDLKEFLINELVAAGNYIYFTNDLHMNVTGLDPKSNSYDYKTILRKTIQRQLLVLKENQGFAWGGYNPLSKKGEDSTWSGRASLFLEVTQTLPMEALLNSFSPLENLEFAVTPTVLMSSIRYVYRTDNKKSQISIENHVYSTTEGVDPAIVRNLYDSSGEPIMSKYPGYFVLSYSLLGEEVQ